MLLRADDVKLALEEITHLVNMNCCAPWRLICQCRDGLMISGREPHTSWQWTTGTVWQWEEGHLPLWRGCSHFYSPHFTCHVGDSFILEDNHSHNKPTVMHHHVFDCPALEISSKCELHNKQSKKKLVYGWTKYGQFITRVSVSVYNVNSWILNTHAIFCRSQWYLLLKCSKVAGHMTWLT